MLETDEQLSIISLNYCATKENHVQIFNQRRKHQIQNRYQIIGIEVLMLFCCARVGMVRWESTGRSDRRFH